MRRHLPKSGALLTRASLARASPSCVSRRASVLHAEVSRVVGEVAMDDEDGLAARDLANVLDVELPRDLVSLGLRQLLEGGEEDARDANGCERLAEF